MLNYYILSFLLIIGCDPASKISEAPNSYVSNEMILPGAYQLEEYLPELINKRVGIVVNHTSTIGNTHLVDTLMAKGVIISSIFSPEHGFKGEGDAGESIKDGKYKGHIPVYSLYGKTKKPSNLMMAEVDILLFDIQDVGVRFYTYLSTLHYVMEAAAENNKPVILLDRPNPNISRVDGPVLKNEFSSFVGLHPVPILYGLTIGEYGQMVNGEGWLAGGLTCDLRVVRCENYGRSSLYELPIAPSPNLPNSRSIYLYPSLCLFEGTTVSVGRGTNSQFQLFGHPKFKGSKFAFTPRENKGAKYPKHQNTICYGIDLSEVDIDSLHFNAGLNLEYLISAYDNLNSQEVQFFNENNFFEKLGGTDLLRNQIKNRVEAEEIRASWQDDLIQFNEVRSRYMIYD